MTHADIATELIVARTEQNLSLEEASRFTKIQFEHLTRLEKGDFSFLPTAYVVSMLCKYAEALGIPNETISLYRRAVSAPAESLTVLSNESSESSDLVRSVHGGSVAARERRATESFSVSPVQLISAFVIALISAGVFLGLKFFSSDDMPSVVVRKEVAPDARPQPSLTTTVVSPMPKTTVPPPTVGNVVQKSSNPETPATTIASAPSTTSPKRLSLVVKTKAEPCWIAVIADKKNSREAYLPPNQVQKFEADSLFTLTLGRAQSAEVWLNGKTITLPRRSGAVSNIRLSSKDL